MYIKWSVVTKEIQNCLSPIGGLEDAVAGVDGSELVGVRLDPATRVVPQREEVVHNLEAVLARWHVNSGDVDQTKYWPVGSIGVANRLHIFIEITITSGISPYNKGCINPL